MAGRTTNRELLEKLDSCENGVTRGVLKDTIVSRFRQQQELVEQLYDELWNMYANVHIHDKEEGELCVDCLFSEVHYKYLEQLLEKARIELKE